jgi:hypothetical protein
MLTAGSAGLNRLRRFRRFGGRIDYHGWNDYTNQWDINLADTKKYASIHDAELKIRLLNHFDSPAPKFPILIVFGMPAD